MIPASPRLTLQLLRIEAIALPFRKENNWMTAEDIALARNVFDTVCKELKVADDDGPRRDAIAYRIMMILATADRDVVSISAKVLEELRGATN